MLSVHLYEVIELLYSKAHLKARFDNKAIVLALYYHINRPQTLFSYSHCLLQVRTTNTLSSTYSLNFQAYPNVIFYLAMPLPHTSLFPLRLLGSPYLIFFLSLLVYDPTIQKCITSSPLSIILLFLFFLLLCSAVFVPIYILVNCIGKNENQ